MSRKEQRKLERLKKKKMRKAKLRLAILIILLGIFCNSNDIIKFQDIFIIKNEIIPVKENESEIAINNNTTKETISTPVIDNTEIEENNIEENTNNVDETKSNADEVEKIVQTYLKEKKLNENNFAFFYYEPETEKTYIYNGGSYFTAASTIKVPLAMIYYDKINNGDLNLDSTFQYQEGDYEEGAGTTAAIYKVGDYVPLSYLLEQMIVNSDNTATNILKTGLGGEKAYRILIKQYTKQELPSEFNDQNITSANYSLDILKKLYENQEKYKTLIELMKKSSGGGYLKKNITTCEIAHKYGSYEGNIHDYGICFSKPKYLIGIFTQKVPDAENLIADMNKEILEAQK